MILTNLLPMKMKKMIALSNHNILPIKILVVVDTVNHKMARAVTYRLPFKIKLDHAASPTTLKTIVFSVTLKPRVKRKSFCKHQLNPRTITSCQMITMMRWSMISRQMDKLI
jgi:hypothetical protein